jgi:hypothetical protein
MSRVRRSTINLNPIIDSESNGSSDDSQDAFDSDRDMEIDTSTTKGKGKASQAQDSDDSDDDDGQDEQEDQDDDGVPTSSYKKTTKAGKPLTKAQIKAAAIQAAIELKWTREQPEGWGDFNDFPNRIFTGLDEGFAPGVAPLAVLDLFKLLISMDLVLLIVDKTNEFIDNPRFKVSKKILIHTKLRKDARNVLERIKK